MNKDQLDRWMDHPITKILFKNLQTEKEHVANDVLYCWNGEFKQDLETNRLYHARGRAEVLGDILDLHIFNSDLDEEEKDE